MPTNKIEQDGKGNLSTNQTPKPVEQSKQQFRGAHVFIPQGKGVPIIQLDGTSQVEVYGALKILVEQMEKEYGI